MIKQVRKLLLVCIVLNVVSGCIQNKIKKLLPGRMWVIEEAVYLKDQDITPYMNLNTLKFFGDNTLELPQLDQIEGGENTIGEWYLRTHNDSVFLVIRTKSWIFNRDYYITADTRKQGDAIVDEIYLFSDTLNIKASR